ncbi:hypothetical protein ACHAQH_008824 [Verticillium albo-atrum]
MPCCLAFLSYAACGHKQLWKIHCTNDCSAVICELSEQEVMASIHYQWHCEDCHTRQWDQKERRRAKRADEDERVIIESDELPNDQKDLFLDSYRIKEDWIDRRVEKSRTEQVEEIQWVAEFAEEYGRIMWELKYGLEDERPRLRKRLDYMLSVKFWDVTIIKDIGGEHGIAARSRASSATLVDDSPVSTLGHKLAAQGMLTLAQHPAEMHRISPGIIQEGVTSDREHQAAPGA